MNERRTRTRSGVVKTRSRTDWKRIDARADHDIDYSDNPKLDTRFFAEAVRWPGDKRQITLRLDPYPSGRDAHHDGDELRGEGLMTPHGTLEL